MAKSRARPSLQYRYEHYDPRLRRVTRGACNCGTTTGNHKPGCPDF